jgi:hypothetical protein
MQEVQGGNPTTKPPPATRHRAVLAFPKPVPLYDMQHQTSSSLLNILQSSRSAKKVMMVKTVSTCRVSRIEANPKYLDLEVSFYPCDTRVDENVPPKLDVNVVMPHGWTPRMYLAALNKSIRKHSVLSLESIRIEGQNYVTINELQWLFSATKEATHSRLVCSASYIRVSGGMLKKI